MRFNSFMKRILGIDFSRTDRSIVGRWWWTVDRPLLFAFIALIIMGILMVTTASPPTAQHLGLGDFHFVVRHIIFLVPSMALFFGLSLLEPRMIWRFSTIVFIGTVVMLVLVPIVGMEIKGARRWLHLPGFSLQPSEFIKPSLIIVTAWLMSLKTGWENKTGFAAAGGLYLLVVTLLLLQPDLGMTIVVTSMIGVQVVLLGLPLKFLAVLGLLGLMGIVAAYFTFHHVRDRIDDWLNPDTGDNYQVERSLEALREGGIMGTGPGHGEVKLRIPDAHADFVFSVAGEEMGALFLFVLISLFLFIILRGMGKLMQAKDMFTILGAGGLLAMFGVQSLIHMGSAVNILPAKGMTLPFMSYGGSSLLSMSVAMGMLLALTRKQSSRGNHFKRK